jgi:hypothetical protein
MKYTNRRSFLSSLAILSAGAGLASVPGFIRPSNMASELEELWTSFWRKNGGRRVQGKFQFLQDELPVCCKGHVHRTGQPVHFDSNIIAVPVWVYWSNNLLKPADVFVTFFEAGTQPKKIIRINRFELEAIAIATAQGEELNIKPLLMKNGRDGSADTSSKMKIKTTIAKDGRAVIAGNFCGRPIALNKNLFYKI